MGEKNGKMRVKECRNDLRFCQMAEIMIERSSLLGFLP